jgi:hypothetical protein
VAGRPRPGRRSPARIDRRVAAHLQPDLPEATLKTNVQAIITGKKGTDLYKAKKAIKDACKAAGITAPSDRQLDAWAAER